MLHVGDNLGISVHEFTVPRFRNLLIGEFGPDPVGATLTSQSRKRCGEKKNTVMFPESSSKPAENLFERANVLQTQKTVHDQSLPRSSGPRFVGENGSRDRSEAASAAPGSLVTTQSLYYPGKKVSHRCTY